MFHWTMDPYQMKINWMVLLHRKKKEQSVDDIQAFTIFPNHETSGNIFDILHINLV